MTETTANATFTRLYSEYYDEVLAYCTRRIGRRDADDATADVFAIVWRRHDEVRWETARPWLYGIARGVLSNRWRSLRRHQRLLSRVTGLGDAGPEPPDVQVVRRDEDRQILEAVRNLKPPDREVLMLAAWEELSSPEIAVALRISVAAAGQRLHRAKRRFAKTLAKTETATSFSPRTAHEQKGGGC